MPTTAREIYDMLKLCLFNRAGLIAQVLLTGVVDLHEVIFAVDGMNRATGWTRKIIAGNGYGGRGAVFVTRTGAPFEGCGRVVQWPTY